MGQAAQLQREEGAEEVLKQFPDIKILAQQTGEWDRAKSMDLMQNWIQSYGDKINAVFAHNDEMGLGAVKALQAARLKDKVLVISVDAIKDALQSVQKGELNATVFQNANQQGAGAIHGRWPHDPGEDGNRRGPAGAVPRHRVAALRGRRQPADRGEDRR